MITLESVKKVFHMGQNVHALSDINLCFQDNEYTAIIGASGSGKSTLLHIMGLIHRPTSGRILYNNVDTVQLSDEERARFRGRSVGFVFQSFHLVPYLSVCENVELPLFYQGVPHEERIERAHQALKTVQLSHRKKHLPRQLSGGESQRTAIARAMISDPEIILADEPTGALDQKTGRLIITLFETLHAKGKTIVVITHDENIASNIPRNIRLLDGRIVEDNMNPALSV